MVLETHRSQYISIIWSWAMLTPNASTQCLVVFLILQANWKAHARWLPHELRGLTPKVGSRSMQSIQCNCKRNKHRTFVSQVESKLNIDVPSQTQINPCVVSQRVSRALGKLNRPPCPCRSAPLHLTGLRVGRWTMMMMMMMMMMIL